MNFFLILVPPFLLLLSAINDISTMKIPNIASVAMLGVFLLAAYQYEFSAHTVMTHLAAGVLILLPGFLLYMFGQVGAGDVKLLSTSALWFGLNQSLLEYIVLVSIFGAVLVLVIFAVRFLCTDRLVAYIFLPNYVLQGKKVPYGVAICLAGLISFPNTEIMTLAIKRIASQ